MIVEESFSIDAPRDRVVEFFLDVERMSGCVPGVGDLRRLGDNEYEATLKIRLGPIQAQFAGKVALDDSAVPERLSAIGSGRDAATGSMAQVAFAAALHQLDDGSTRIDSTSDVTIRGRLGQFGTGVVTSTAKTMVQEFAVCAGQAIEAASNGQRDAPPPAPTVGRIIRRTIAAYFQDLWRKLRRLIGNRSGRDRSG